MPLMVIYTASIALLNFGLWRITNDFLACFLISAGMIVIAVSNVHAHEREHHKDADRGPHGQI